MISNLSNLFHSRAKGRLILALFIAFVVFVAGTLPLLQKAPGGDIESLDAKFFYTPEEAFSTVASYGDAGRFWIRIYLTWDIAIPIMYTLIFGLLISWLFQRSFKEKSKLQKWNVLPVFGGLFDIFENISIVILLSVYPSKPPAIAWMGTFCTMSKTIVLGMSTLLMLIGLIKAMINRFKKQ
jgi:hypothetical protein